MYIIIDFFLKDFKRFVKWVVLDHLASLEMLGFLEKANSEPPLVTYEASFDGLIASISRYWKIEFGRPTVRVGGFGGAREGPPPTQNFFLEDCC